MLTKRDHPVLRRRQRPRRQGHLVRRAARRRRPGGAGEAVRRARAPTSWCSSTSRRRATTGRRPTTWSRATADEVFIPFTVGGGVRSDLDVRVLLELGADKVSLNSAAVADPKLVARLLRALRRAVHRRRDRRAGAWARARGRSTRTAAAAPTGLDAVEWAKQAVELGAGELLVTSMDTDGHKDGYDIPLTRAISEAVEVPVIASGGCGNPQHMVDAVVERQGRRGARGEHLPLRRVLASARRSATWPRTACPCAMRRALRRNSTHSHDHTRMLKR